MLDLESSILIPFSIQFVSHDRKSHWVDIPGQLSHLGKPQKMWKVQHEDPQGNFWDRVLRLALDVSTRLRRRRLEFNGLFLLVIVVVLWVGYVGVSLASLSRRQRNAVLLDTEELLSLHKRSRRLVGYVKIKKSPLSLWRVIAENPIKSRSGASSSGSTVPSIPKRLSMSSAFSRGIIIR